MLNWEENPTFLCCILHVNLTKHISPQPHWFRALNISWQLIFKCFRQKLVHNLLPDDSFRLNKVLITVPHLAFPILVTNFVTSANYLYVVHSLNRHKLKDIFSSLGIHFSHTDSFSSNHVSLIKSIINFILQKSTTIKRFHTLRDVYYLCILPYFMQLSICNNLC